MTEPMQWSDDAKREYQLQSYGARPTIDGVEIVNLTRHADDGGSITELVRLDGGQPQARRASPASPSGRSTSARSSRA